VTFQTGGAGTSAPDEVQAMESDPLHPVRPQAAPAGEGVSPGSSAAIAEEHRVLRELLGRITATRDLGALLPQLGELEGLLALHFAHEEEADGLHAVVADSAPDRLPEVQRLFDEHREIARRVMELRERAEELWRGPLAEVLEGVAELADRLHRHEAAEGDLLAGALYDDLGIGS
jgi:hypothetical protein